MANLNNIYPDLEDITSSSSYKSSVVECYKYIGKNSKTLTLLHLNVRSINKNFDSLRLLLCALNIQCDILILSECWLSKVVNLPELEGYKSYSTKNIKNQNDGVVIYVKNYLNYIVHEPFFLDANCLVCKLDNNLAVVALYRSPSYNNIDNFINSLNRILQTLSSFKHIVIIGDNNIDIKNDNNDPHSDHYLNLTASHGFLPAHLLPTRLNNCLDHVFIKTNLKATTIVLDSPITDHFPVLLNLSLVPLKQQHAGVGTKLNLRAATCAVETSDFSTIFSFNDANRATEHFLGILSNIISTHTISFTIPCRQRIIKPWITTGLLRCIRNRDSMHRKVYSDPNNIILASTYKRYRNFCNNLLKKLKREYERSEFDKAKHSPKRTWEVIKKLTLTNNRHDPPLELLNSSSYSRESVNCVNSHFANVGKELASRINPTADSCSPFIKSGVPPLNSMVLSEVTESEVRDIIRGLRKCAVGWDGIPTELLKSASPVLTPIITYICNLAITTGTFPNALKKAIVHPIHKSGDRANVCNYRPISVLSALSKILEKIINRSLVGFLETNKIISENQFGFRRSRSTEDAIGSLVKHAVKEIDEMQKCVGIFLDLSKAFDTVSVPLLLNKLETVGIRGNVLNILADYLTNRTQSTKIGTYVSQQVSLEYGVPQGSILGPTLFLLYVNDLCDMSVPHCRVWAYADDMALVISGTNWSETGHYAEGALKIAMRWLNNNLLTLNVDKTKFITLATRPSAQPALDSIKIRAHTCTSESVCDCFSLTRISSIKYLGVFLDESLNWYNHIQSVTGRVRKLIFIFKKLRNSADLNILNTVYTALCASILTYCIPVWGGAFKTSFINLERAQRVVLKIMHKKPFRYPTSQLYAEAGVLTVRQMYILRTTLCQHASLPSTAYSRPTRKSKPKVCPTTFCRTSFARRQMASVSCRIYNKINTILQIHELNKFDCKNKLRTWLTTLEYGETEELLM